LQAGRRNVFRQVGQHVYQVLTDVEESKIARARHALFGDEQQAAYELLASRLAFVENGRDDLLFLEQYVLLGNYQNDPDRFEAFQALLLDFLHHAVATGGSNGDLNSARTAHQTLVNAALAARSDLAILETERGTIQRRMERGGGVLARVGLGGDQSQLTALLLYMNSRMEAAQKKTEFQVS
jgi:hypothetical protein